MASALLLSLPATSMSYIRLKKPAVKYAPAPVAAPIVEPTLSKRQTIWLHALMWCESKGKPEALNPKDKDGTPSYGILQFKPGTFNHYAKLYGIDASAGYKDADTQEKIVTQMILKGNIKWSQQFPQCTKQLGLPPK